MTKIKYAISKYLSLKLEDDKTIIYISGKPFRHCKYLLIKIPINKISTFDELESIDEAAEKLDNSMEPRKGKIYTYRIPPEVEFWGHCSNIQVWYEQDYNTKLLHSNLGFPLLGALAKAGDTQAQKVFKEEIAERYNTGGESTRKFLRNMKYLDYLSIEEFLSLIENENEREAITILRVLHPHIERRNFGGVVLNDNIDIKKGKIIRLCLSGLELRKVPEIVRELKSLEFIDLSYNLLENLPDWISELKELKELEISNNSLKELPEAIGEMESLEKILACNNNLKLLPESIGNLKKLKKLELYENQLKKIPSSIGNLSNIKTLDFHKNQITCLPNQIGNLTNLKKLILDENQLTFLPESIGNLVDLEFLILGSNDLRKLPNSIERLKKLKRLDVSNNVYFMIPEFIYNLPILEYLFVRDLYMSKSQIIRAKEKFKKFINKDIKIFF